MTKSPFAALVGPFFALATIFSWAGYNLAAKVGVTEGFRPQDLAFLRFFVAALLLTPIATTVFRSGWTTIGWRRLLILSLIGGPIFSYIANAGLQFAPLSHGLLFAPAAVLVLGMALALIINKEKPTAAQNMGSLLLLLGLTVLAAGDLRIAGGEVLIGDALFVLAGLMWGTFTFLLAHWRISPLEGTVIVSVSSGWLAVPFYVVTSGMELPAVPGSDMLFQAAMQGVLGGVLAIYFFMRALEQLGSSKAAMLPTFTPGAGILLTFIFLGVPPSITELAGIGISMVGLFLALKPN